MRRHTWINVAFLATLAVLIACGLLVWHGPAHPLSAEGLCRNPEVATAQAPLSSSAPALRIIQIFDYHYVPPDEYAKGMRQRPGDEPLSPERCAASHNAHLMKVEAIQREQASLLRRLAKDHGIRRIFVEGLTPEGVQDYKANAEALYAADREEPALAKQLSHRRAVVAQGSAARLLAEGVIEEVLPLHDAETLALALRLPFLSGRVLHFSPSDSETVFAAMVRRLANGGPVALCLLAGSNDLTAAIKKQGLPRCEYVRVTTTTYLRLSQSADGEE
jgi:hypothetical protein